MLISCVVSNNKAKKKPMNLQNQTLLELEPPIDVIIKLRIVLETIKQKLGAVQIQSQKQVQNSQFYILFKSETRYRSLQVVRCHICNTH